MLPVFVGLLLWVVLLVLLFGLTFLVFHPLRRFFGFVFLTPLLGTLSAFGGFLVVGWLLHGRLREEAAVSIAFYIGFLLCGAVGSVLGMIGGFFIWRRVRRPLASA
jgi:hypothetical protein